MASRPLGTSSPRTRWARAVRARSRSALVIPAVALLVGCGASNQTFTVGGKTLVVQDQGYYTTTGVDYCNAGAPGQMKLDFVDYPYICDPRHLPARDPAQAHTELQILLAIGAHPNMTLPYAVGVADCTNGPTMEAIGIFLHYPPSSTKPDMTVQASSGSFRFTEYSTDKVKPLGGTFDMKFGGDDVKGTFQMYACN